MKTIFAILFVLFSIQISFSQIGKIRIPNESSKIDSSQYPFANYAKVVSYSFNRKGRIELEKRYKELLEILKDKNKDSLRLQETIDEFDLIADQYNLGERSLVIDGKIIHTAEKMQKLDIKQIAQLNEIFQNYESDNSPNMSCIPFYRDGLIFYSESGEMIAHIDICFDCGIIRFNPKHSIPLNLTQWQGLKKYFNEELGHPID